MLIAIWAVISVLAIAQSIMSFVFYAQKCIGCRQCVAICPVGAIEFVNGRPVIAMGKCIACMKCIPACPTGALSYVAPVRDETAALPAETITIFLDTAASVPFDAISPADNAANSGAHAAARDTAKEMTPAPIGDSGIPKKPAFLVIAEKCIGCGICVPLCPAHAIEIVSGKAIIDPGKCTSCGTCMASCPAGAIKME